jgi:hypothetical protein
MEYIYYSVICEDYEADVYDIWGAVTSMDENALPIAIQHLSKARAIYNLLGVKHKSEDANYRMSLLTERIRNGRSNTNTNAADAAASPTSSSATISPSVFKHLQLDYNESCKKYGLTSELTLMLGVTLANELKKQYHGIKAERLITELANASRRVHGPDHTCTKSTNECLMICKTRFVTLLPEQKEPYYIAIRYENDGQICIVRGPIIVTPTTNTMSILTGNNNKNNNPRRRGGNSNNEEVNTTNENNILHVPSNHIIPAKGCPVICHGLVNASYLNGQIGEVRDLIQKSKSNTDNNTSSLSTGGNSCNDGIRLAVYFEKRGMRNALVKPENLRIVFDLEEEEEKMKKKESK